MGLDSVELVIATEETFGISIPDKDATEMTTPAHLIAYVQNAVKSTPFTRPCLSQRAFHRIRTNLCEVTKIPRREIRLDSKIDHLFPKYSRAKQWEVFRAKTGLHALPQVRFGRVIFFLPKTVRDLVKYEMNAMANQLRETSGWTDQEVRSVVRLIISEQLGIKQFNDTDHFIDDLNLQ